MKPQKAYPRTADEHLLNFWKAQLRESAGKPWLAGLLLQHGQTILLRCAAYYEALSRLPARRQLALRRRFALGLAGAALMLALSGARFALPAAHAGDIVVSGSCTLADAITTANTGSDTGACSGGSAGVDTITLTKDETLTSPLPNIISEIILEGGGYTISRDSGADRFGILHVDGYDVNQGSLTLNEATISGGDAPNGGGIYVNYGDLTVQESTITGNKAEQGGGIFVYQSTNVQFSRSTISFNEATIYGGGLYAHKSKLFIRYSTINDNSALLGGGGAHVLVGDFTFENSTISGNIADFSLGASANGAGAVAANGGGIEFLDAPGDYGSTYAYLFNSTVTGNEATGYGGGIATLGMVNDGDVQIQRSIISGNDATAGPEIADSDPAHVTAGGYNIVGYGGSARSYNFTPGGSDIAPAGALNTILDTAGGLQDNGGPTFTYDLVEGSPAVDSVPTGESSPYDQRGAARDFNMDAGAISISSPGADTDGDVGAVEYGSPVPTAVTLQSLAAATPDPSALAALAGGGLLASSLALWRRLQRR